MLHSSSISNTPKHTMGVCFSEYKSHPHFIHFCYWRGFLRLALEKFIRMPWFPHCKMQNPLFFLPSPSICILCFIVQHGKSGRLQALAFVVIFFALPQQSIALFLCCTKECRVPSVQACNLFKITSFELM